jgi:hypothetical protein
MITRCGTKHHFERTWRDVMTRRTLQLRSTSGVEWIDAETLQCSDLPQSSVWAPARFGHSHWALELLRIVRQMPPNLHLSLTHPKSNQINILVITFDYHNQQRLRRITIHHYSETTTARLPHTTTTVTTTMTTTTATTTITTTATTTTDRVYHDYHDHRDHTPSRPTPLSHPPQLFVTNSTTTCTVNTRSPPHPLGPSQAPLLHITATTSRVFQLTQHNYNGKYRNHCRNYGRIGQSLPSDHTHKERGTSKVTRNRSGRLAWRYFKEEKNTPQLNPVFSERHSQW